MLAGALADRIRYGRAQRARARAAPREAVAAAQAQAPDADEVANDKEARQVLTGLGYKKWIATEAVREARSQLGVKTELKDLIQAALRACPKVMSAEAS